MPVSGNYTTYNMSPSRQRASPTSNSFFGPTSKFFGFIPSYRQYEVYTNDLYLANKKKRRNLPPILKLVSHLNKILNQADCPSFQDRGTKVFWTMLWSIFLYSFPLQWKKLLMALNWTSAYNDLVFMGRKYIGWTINRTEPEPACYCIYACYIRRRHGIRMIVPTWRYNVMPVLPYDTLKHL